MDKINTNDILECIDDFEIEVKNNNYNNKTKIIRYDKGVKYLVKEAASVCAIIRTSDGDSHAFVYDSIVFNAPSVFKHFRLYKKYNPNSLVIKEQRVGRFVDRDRRYYSYNDRYWSKESFSKKSVIEDFSDYSHVVSKDEHDIPFKSAKCSMDAWKTSSLKVYKNLFQLSISVELSKHNSSYKGKNYLSKYDLSGLKNLCITNDNKNNSRIVADDNPKYFDINSIKFPKSLETLNVDGVYLDELPKNKKLELTVNNSSIKKLSLKDISNFKFSNIVFEEYDNLVYRDVIKVDRHKYGNKADVVILKIDDDRYALSDAKRILSKKEINVFCSTYQLKKAIEFFDLDEDCKFEFKCNGWDNENNNKYKFKSNEIKKPDGSVVNNVEIYKEGDIYKLFRYVGLSFYNHRTDLYYSKERGLFIDDLSLYSTETINDVSLNELTKLSEDVRFPDTFFKEFFEKLNTSKSKFVGEIDIKDFDWHLFSYETENIIGIIWSDMKWKIIKEVDNYDSYLDNNRNRVHYISGKTDGVSIIDWGKEKFKLKNLNADYKVFLNPDHKDYYKYLENYSKDDMLELTYNTVIPPTFDEDVKYLLTCDEEALENNEFLIYDNKIFRKGTGFYRYYGDKGNRALASLEDSKGLAKKYGFKLELLNVLGDTYRDIENVMVRSYDDHENVFNTCISFSKGLETVLNQQNPFMNKNAKLDNISLSNPVIKIGKDLYMFTNNKRFYKIYLDKKTDKVCVNEENSNDIITYLDKNDRCFSFINFNFSDSLMNRFFKFTDKYKDDLTINSFKSSSLRLNISLMHIGLYNHGYNFSITKWNNDKEEEYAEIKKKILKFEDPIQKELKSLIRRSKTITTSKNVKINLAKNVKKEEKIIY